MKRLLLSLILSSAALHSQAQPGSKFGFVDSIRLGCPAVQDQQMSGTCWCFSTTSFLEAEMMLNGNPTPPNLSEMFIVWHNYLDRARKHVMLHGKMNFGQGSYFSDNLAVIRKHGIVPEAAYPNVQGDATGINHYPMERRLKAFADSVADNGQKKIDPGWVNDYAAILDGYLGKLPETFEYEGRTYTPQSFAKEVVRLDPDDYVQVTSFSHHEFGKYCILEIPDNWRDGRFLNVEIDQLEQIIDSSLAKGHTVLWGADVSEPGCKIDMGFALLPGINPARMKAADIQSFQKLPPEKQIQRAKPLYEPGIEINVTQESRQADFLSRNTTDDHGMHIVGIAHDKTHKKYYIVKNSWGDSNIFNGYFYASANYVKAKTTGILVHKSACRELADNATWDEF